MIRPLLQKPPFTVRTLRHFELIPGPAVPMSLAVPFADESIEMDALRKCAANGDDGSQLDLALRYRDGNGVEKDHAEAMHRALRAAAPESAQAAFNLGQCYCGAQSNAILSRPAFFIENR
jgi:TPR repeat protein